MLATTPTTDYHSRRNINISREPSMSPSCRARYNTSTPPRRTSGSPLLTPSPLRRRPLFSTHATPDNDGDDIFLQSPFKSPLLHPSVSYSMKPQIDDDEGGLFLSSTSASIFPSSSSQPLRTPVKQIHRAASRSALTVKHLNSPLPPMPNTAAAALPGLGTKRKSAGNFSTPLRQHALTPLIISNSKTDDSGGTSFHRLAPLPAPKFGTRATPQTKAETEVHLKSQTATLTRLKITDLNDSAGEEDDSGCEIEDEDVLFLNRKPTLKPKPKMKGKPVSMGRTLGRQTLGKKEEVEVVEAVSPGGHITKRRARSRPVSWELQQSVARSPPSSVMNTSAVAFPSSLRSRTTSSSSSEAGSPLPRRRVSGVHFPAAARPPMSRIESATLFFGPPIPPPNRPRASVPPTHPTPRVTNAAARHSYAGPSANASWNVMQTRLLSSPGSSPPAASKSGYEDEEDLFFGSGLQDSSFVFSLTEGTPSPRSKKQADRSAIAIQKKFKPRDSGIGMLSDGSSSEYLNGMPGVSTSVSSIGDGDGDDCLVTPGFAPGEDSGWPEAEVRSGYDDDMVGEKSMSVDPNVDAFIMRTLKAGAKPMAGHQDGPGPKKAPGTPVKKNKTSYLTGDRPWQSAVANKVGLVGYGDDDDDEAAIVNVKGKKVPRKSLPAAFPALMPMRSRKAGKSMLDPGTDSDGECIEESPSSRKDKVKDKYAGLGLGRPSFAGKDAPIQRRWLMRRSSSGAFSSGSETTTPTRVKGKDWNLPPPRIPAMFSPTNGLKFSPVRSASGSSNSSVATLNSPTTNIRHLPTSGGVQNQKSKRPSTHVPLHVRRSSEPFTQEQPGRFERDFVEVGEVGSGEFGKVMKVRCQSGNEDAVFAVKKSKKFEGLKHRLRLREEVDILQHLSNAAAVSCSGGAYRHHPNVLAFIDSWEQDEALLIRTELCELGNFARFLWEYGRTFPRLDEARVWKIIADVSNGLCFIHDSGVIHLDIKPANIFVTGEGRFKIGDFGMASIWPRPSREEETGFEREGDKLYLAPEILQGRYGKAADIFSFGMTMLETASNIVVPDQGEPWHRLRQEDFSQVDLEGSPELLDIIQSMMRTDPDQRIDVHGIWAHPVVSRARGAMERVYNAAKAQGLSVFPASPLASVAGGFLEEILERRVSNDEDMDLSQ